MKAVGWDGRGPLRPCSLGLRLSRRSTLIPILNDAPGALNILGGQRAHNHKDQSWKPIKKTHGSPGLEPFTPRAPHLAG